MITMTLEGGKALEKKMLDLEKKVSKKINRQAVRAGIKTILAPAKANASSFVGGDMGKLISRSLQIAVGKVKRPSQYYLQVRHNPKYNDRFVSYARGASSSLSTKKTTGQRYYIPSAIEYGHIKRGGGGMVAPISYLRSAFDANTERAKTRLRRTLFLGIERAWRVG